MTGPDLLSQFSSAIVERAATAAPSIVEIASQGSLASGFVWRDGLIITAEETLADEGEILVEFADGSHHGVSLIGRDPSTDIALLRIEGVATKPAVLSTDVPRAGSLVVIAAAAESAPLVTSAIAIAVGPAWRSMRGGQIDARIELDLQLRRRAEGGLALRPDGDAIGMTVRGPRGRTLVIPSSTIERVAPLLLEHGEVPRGYLGLALKDIAVPGDGRGAVVMGVDSDGPSAAAGILQGDIILRWNEEPVRSVHSLIHALDYQSIGRAIRLVLRRAGQDVEAAVTISKLSRG